MRLAVNGWRIHGKRTGVGRYLLNVLRHWTPDVLEGRFERVTVYTHKPIDRAELSIPENINVRVLGPQWRMLLWENFRFGPVVRDDVQFSPSYTRPLIARGCPVVTTHDATQKLYPHLFPRSVRYLYNPLYGWSARRAGLVITDSEAGRNDIASCWGVPIERIRVVHLAPEERFRESPSAEIRRQVRQEKIGFNEPYFLFVGKLSGRRSTPLLLRGFAEFKRKFKSDHKLLVIGLNIHNLDVMGMIEELGITDEVRHCEYVSDDDLCVIYHEADVFVSPSIYESVSLPVMEAQAAGTAVICPDTPGMRELTGGDASLLPKPEVGEMAEAMGRPAKDSDFRGDLARRGLENSKRFSWKRCSHETLDVFEEAGRMRFSGSRSG